MGSSYGGVWPCIAGFWDLQTTSFEIPWFLGWLNCSLPTTCTGDSAGSRYGSTPKSVPGVWKKNTADFEEWKQTVGRLGLNQWVVYGGFLKWSFWFFLGCLGGVLILPFKETPICMMIWYNALFLIRSIVFTQSRNPLCFCPIQDFLLTKNTFVSSYVLWDDLLDNLLCPVISLEATDPSSEIYGFTRIHPYHSSGYVPTWIVEFLWDQSR